MKPYLRILTGVITAAVHLGVSAQADTTPAYGAIEYDGVKIEAPLGWKYDDDEVRRQLEQNSRDVLQSRKSAVPAIKNNILLAAVLPDLKGRNAATLRVSIRDGQVSSQAEMRQGLSNVSSAEVATLMAPSLEEALRVLRSMPGVSSARALGGSIARNATLVCMFTEIEYTRTAEPWRTQTWVCPAGRRTVKLSTGYRVSDATTARPVIDHLWKTLSIGP